MNSTDSASLIQKPIRSYIRRYPRAFALGTLTLFLTNLFDTLTPLALKWGIDAIAAKDMGRLQEAIGAFVLLMFLVAIFRYLWRAFFGRFQHTVAEDLRNRIFARFTELGPSFYQKNPIGQLMSLISNDVNTFRMAIGPGLLILLDGAFLIGMILPMMIWLAPDWTWKTLLLLPLVPFLMRRMEHVIHDRFRVQQDRLSEVSGRAQEIVSGARVIKSYAQEDNQRRLFDQDSKAFEMACNRVAMADALFEPLMEFLVAAGAVILLYLCTDRHMQETITLGTLFAFYDYIRKMIWPMSALGFGVSMVEQGRASFDRIAELLKTHTDTPDTGTLEVRHFESLRVQNVTFRYPGAEISALEDISFEIKAGETIGIVGPVGSGKTTLLNLICRLYPLQTGRISINGHPVELLRKENLYNLVSYVPQEAFLFSDTISENMAFGLSNWTDHTPLQHMAAIVNIDVEIEGLPQGYNTYLGERGVNLSGGQKQRLTIARALLRKTPVLILDDSLSAVDHKTERNILNSLKETLQDRHARTQTTILISHRLAALSMTDRILVFKDGHLEAQGSPEELLRTSPTYRNLHSLQSENEEGHGRDLLS